MKIRSKLLVYILTISISIYIIAIGFVGINFSKIAYQSAKRIAETEADNYANKIKADLDADLSVTRGVAQIFEAYYQFPDTSLLFRFLMETQLNILAKNPDFMAFATSFEYSAILPDYPKDFGRIQLGYSRSGNKFVRLKKEKNMLRDDINSLYYYAKSNKAELFTNPYRDSYSGRPEDSIFMASIAVPILSPQGKFAGLAGVDISLDRFQQMIEDIKPFEDSYSFLVSNNGMFIAHPDPSKLTSPVINDFPDLEEKYELSNLIATGKRFSAEYKDVSGVDYFVSFVPVELDKIKSPWSIGIAVPVEVIYSTVRYNIFISVVIGVIGILFIIFIVWYTARQISIPMEKTTQVLYQLSEGDILSVKELNITGSQEIELIGHSVNKLISGLRKMAEFAEEIGKGNFNKKLDKLSDNDVIGDVLIKMSNNLAISLAEDKKRQEQERKESWIAKGIAQLSNILRAHYDDFYTFSADLLSEIIKYTGTKIGAVFIYFEHEKLLKQTATFGPDEILSSRTEFKPRQSEIGRAFASQKTIILDNIPKDFFKIRSGLGEKTPEVIYVVPFVLNDECFGVIEVADIERLEDYKIQYLERISESIAVTISRLKYNFQTRSLLEKTRKDAGKLQNKEEVLNKQLQDMEKVKQMMELKAKETDNLLEAIYSVAYVATYDMDGKLIDANDALLHLLGAEKEDVIGKYQGTFKVNRSAEEEVEFQNFWKDLRAGATKKLIQEIEIKGKKILLSETYTPIFDKEGRPSKVLNLILDITHTRNNQLFS